MKVVKIVVILAMAALATGCNVTPDFVDNLVETNTNTEYPSKARFKREAQQRQDRIDNRFDDSGVSGFLNAFISSANEEYPSRQRFAKQGLLKDAMLMQELRERKVGANHHIPELMQVAVTTDNDPRWVPIVGHKRRHASYSEPEVNNPRFVALVGPK
jgi:hypothetical protein